MNNARSPNWPAFIEPVEHGLDLPLQRRVPEALLGDERIAVRRIALARGMVNLGDLSWTSAVGCNVCPTARAAGAPRRAAATLDRPLPSAGRASMSPRRQASSRPLTSASGCCVGSMTQLVRGRILPRGDSVSKFSPRSRFCR